MKRLIFIFFIAVGICQLSAQDNVFSFTVPENIVTQNEENTKSVNVNRVLLDQISKNSNDFLINSSFDIAISNPFFARFLCRFSVF